jgi:hypothetical protein
MRGKEGRYGKYPYATGAATGKMSSLYSTIERGIIMMLISKTIILSIIKQL